MNTSQSILFAHRKTADQTADQRELLLHGGSRHGDASLALAEQLLPEPFPDRALRGADALEAGVLALELPAQRLRHGHGEEVLDMLGVAAHQADHGFRPPGVHHEVVGVVFLGAHRRILGMPVVVAPLQIHGHGVLGREVPGNVERCEVLELCHRSAPCPCECMSEGHRRLAPAGPAVPDG